VKIIRNVDRKFTFHPDLIKLEDLIKLCYHIDLPGQRDVLERMRFWGVELRGEGVAGPPHLATLHRLDPARQKEWHREAAEVGPQVHSADGEVAGWRLQDSCGRGLAAEPRRRRALCCPSAVLLLHPGPLPSRYPLPRVPLPRRLSRRSPRLPAVVRRWP